jgi:Holliday junction resolvase RusA-like endonuclease
MDAAELTFEIAGDPRPQPRARMTRSGHAYTPDNGIKAYKGAIALRVGMEAKRRKLGASRAAHELEVEFVFARPPSHWTKGGTLTSSAPAYPPKRCGDLDNLAKAVADAITDSGAVWHDDDQVVQAILRKRYGARREPARTVIVIRRLSHAEADPA